MNEQPEIKLLLDDKDFASLVSGGILTIQHLEAEVKIALKDIGWPLMKAIIIQCENGEIKPYTNRER